ncbi:MAG: hypothetical protein JST30_05205 [Armatimonadetes bacterium]|nr:hypothetical protein [Armatimonadota bacterium]
MLAFLLAQAPVQTTGPDIAYIARYYTPENSKAKSRSAVYVCDWTGKRTRKVATPEKDVYAVVWAGSGRLVWFCDGKTGPDEVWTATPQGADARQIGTVSNPEPWHSHPGTPYFQDASGVEPVWYTVTPEGALTKTTTPVSPFAAISHDLSSKDGKWSLRINDDDEGKLVLFDSQGAAKDLAHQGMFYDAKVEPARDRVWIRTRDHDSTTGTHFWLYTVDWAGRRLVPRIEDYAMADFWPSRDETVYMLPRSLGKLGKKTQVWVSPMFAGNVRTGQFRKIVSGTVWVQWVALQPR